MLNFEFVNKDNIELAIEIQHLIFPNENGKQDLIDSMNHTPPPHQFLQESYVVKNINVPVGIVGLYAYNDYPKDAWLGWYGVLEKERNKGYGKLIFEFAKKLAIEKGFSTLRLYTDEEDNFVATKLYEKLGMTSEYYENKEDKYHSVGKILIYSISLNNQPIEKWNSKNLSLGGHEEWNK